MQRGTPRERRQVRELPARIQVEPVQRGTTRERRQVRELRAPFEDHRVQGAHLASADTSESCPHLRFAQPNSAVWPELANSTKK